MDKNNPNKNIDFFEGLNDLLNWLNNLSTGQCIILGVVAVSAILISGLVATYDEQAKQSIIFTTQKPDEMTIELLKQNEVKHDQMFGTVCELIIRDPENANFYLEFLRKYSENNRIDFAEHLSRFVEVKVTTPLEAFKTDSIFSVSNFFDVYPSLVNIQVNSQLFLSISLGFFFFGLAICFLLNTRIRFQIVSFYLTLCAFYLNQLQFSMRNYFVSFLSILLIIGGFNILGLVPYTGSFTAQIIINLNFTIAVIIGLVLIGFNMHGVQFLRTFIPQNVPSVMIPFLFIIEILSFLMRIFSMSIRLFSNMVAGHSLLHLLTEFVYFLLKLTSGKTLYLILSFIPLGLLYFWLFFELFVALLQAYVFVLLYLLYLHDVHKTH